jgi:ABC-type branched-subunit amino acid transport system permease subunit
MQFALNAFMSFSFTVTGIYLFYWFTVKSLRDGKAKTRHGESSRQNDPVSFWLAVVAGVLVGGLACFMAVFILLHPVKMW